MAETVAGILIAATVIGALFVIGRGAAWLWAVLRKLGRLADDLTGEPPRPGFPQGRPGVLDRLTNIEATLATVATLSALVAIETRLVAVEAQLHPDRGTSLRDAVDRIASGEAAPVALPEAV